MVVFKVMPADGNTDISELESRIRSKISAKKIEREPIAFGLVALKVTTTMMDAEGVVDKMEQHLRDTEGVGEVEVIEISRVL